MLMIPSCKARATSAAFVDAGRPAAAYLVRTLPKCVLTVDAVMYKALAAKVFDSVRNHWIKTSRSRSDNDGRDARVSANIAPAILGDTYG